MIAASLHVNHLSPSFALALLCLLRMWAYSISPPPRPIYLIQSLRRNWNFYWDEGDNSCKCANWRLAPGRDVKPSEGIKKSKVWNAAHSCVMYHAAPLGRSRLTGYMVCGSAWVSECNRGHAPLLMSTSVHKTPFVSLLWPSESLSSLLLKGKWMCGASAMQIQSWSICQDSCVIIIKQLVRNVSCGGCGLIYPSHVTPMT